MNSLTKTLPVLLLALSLTGCVKDKVSRTYTLFKPVYERKENVLATIKSEPGKALEKPGKIYVYGHYLFVNEVNEGVHVFNYADPAKPVNQAFIRIPGNLDIAVRGNTLYADVYSDMLTIDISDLMAAKVTHSYPNVFPERTYSSGVIADSTQYIVGWEQRDTTIAYDDPNPCFGCVPGVIWMNDAAEFAASTATKSAVGVAGSMARFSIVDNFLYLVNAYSLQAFDISTPATPVKSTEPLFFFDELETIYPFRDKLFIGATTGMFIYDISTSGQPVYVSHLAHFRVCDPVITDGDFAYATLRATALCGGIQESQLQVVDVHDIQQPTLLTTVPMKDPYGLGKSGNLLWVCDGEAGLKILDISNPKSPSLVKQINGINPYDIIPINGIMLVSAKEGIFLYNADPANIHLESKLQ